MWLSYHLGVQNMRVSRTSQQSIWDRHCWDLRWPQKGTYQFDTVWSSNKCCLFVFHLAQHPKRKIKLNSFNGMLTQYSIQLPINAIRSDLVNWAILLHMLPVKPSQSKQFWKICWYVLLVGRYPCYTWLRLLNTVANKHHHICSVNCQTNVQSC